MKKKQAIFLLLYITSLVIIFFVGFEQTLIASPYPLSVYDKGIRSFEEGNYTGAISYFDKVIEDFSKFPYGSLSNLYALRGMAKANLGKMKQALKDFDKAIVENSDDPHLYYQRGFILFQLREFSQAITNFSQLISISPEDATAYYYRGRAKKKIDRWAEAITDINKAIFKNPKNAYFYYERAIMKKRLGMFRYHEIIEDLDEAILLNPKNPNFYILRGRIRADHGKQKEAIEDGKMALKLNPQLKGVAPSKTQIEKQAREKKDLDKKSSSKKAK